MKQKKELALNRLKELLTYDPIKGTWTRNITIKRNKKGSIAGYIDKHNGYRRIKIDGVPYGSNRLAFFYMEGYFPEHHVDHINRIRHDDRWCNLRHVTVQCNIRNCGLSINNNSNVKGVYWNKLEDKWKAFVYIDSKYKHLGYHKEFSEAVLTRLAAEQCLDWHGCDSSSSAYNYAIENKLIRRQYEDI